MSDAANTEPVTNDSAGDTTSTTGDDASTVKDTGILASGDDTGGGEGEGGDDSTSSGGEPEGKPGEGEFVLSLPEGVTLDEAQTEAFTAVAKDAGINGEQAGKLAAWDAERQKAAAAAQVEAWEKQDASWSKELQGDTDFGGDNLKATVVEAKRALRKFGGEALAKDLREHGIGNLPSLVRAFARMGRVMAEDDTGGSDGAGGGAPLSRDEKLAKYYDNSQ